MLEIVFSVKTYYFISFYLHKTLNIFEIIGTNYIVHVTTV